MKHDNAQEIKKGVRKMYAENMIWTLGYVQKTVEEVRREYEKDGFLGVKPTAGNVEKLVEVEKILDTVFNGIVNSVKESMKRANEKLQLKDGEKVYTVIYDPIDDYPTGVIEITVTAENIKEVLNARYKSYFPTREEAEQAVKERNDEN